MQYEQKRPKTPFPHTDEMILSGPTRFAGVDYGTWLAWCEEVEDVTYLVLSAGGMATKSWLDEWLVERYQISRGDAHDITNHVESWNRRTWRANSQSGALWVAERPEPRFSQYGLSLDRIPYQRGVKVLCERCADRIGHPASVTIAVESPEGRLVTPVRFHLCLTCVREGDALEPIEDVSAFLKEGSRDR